MQAGQILPLRVKCQRVPVVETCFHTSMRAWTLNMKNWIESGNPEIGVKNAVAAMLGDTLGQLSSVE
jgi:hypothetical protein